MAGDINAKLTADASQLIGEIRKATSEMTKFGKAAKKAQNDFTKSVNKNVSSTNKLKSNIKKATKELDAFGKMAKGAFKVGAISAIIYAVKQFAEFAMFVGRSAEAMTLMGRKMDSFVHDASALDKAVVSAQKMGSSLEDTVGVMTRFAIASDGAFETEEMLGWVEGLQAAGMLVGSTTDEINAGLQQLSQGFTKGTLDGDELKSVLETMPLLGKSLRKVMDTEMKATGKSLRELGADGKIMGKQMIAAMEDLKKSTVPAIKGISTIDQELARVSTSWKLFADEGLFWVDDLVKGSISLFDDMLNGFTWRIKKMRYHWNVFTNDFGDLDNSETIRALYETSQKIAEIEQSMAALKKRGNKWWDPRYNLSLIESAKEVENLRKEQEKLLAIVNKNGSTDDDDTALRKKAMEAREASEDAARKRKETKDKAAKDKAYEATLAAERRKLDALESFNDEIQQMVIDNIINEKDQIQAQENFDIEVKRREIDRLIEQYGQKQNMEDNFQAWMVNRKKQSELEIGVIDTKTHEKKIGALEAWGKKTIDVNQEMEKIVVSGAEKMADGFAEMAVSGEMSFGKFAESFIKDITKMIIKAYMLKAVQSYFGYSTGVGSGTGTTPAATTKHAKGGAFTNKLYNKPTKFAYGGGFGVMGEAGPEAVMPLSKGPDGKLGVKASGGGGSGGTVIVNVTNYGKEEATVTQSQGPNGDNMIDVLIGQVQESIATDVARGSGPVSQSIETTYNLNRAYGSYS